MVAMNDGFDFCERAGALSEMIWKRMTPGRLQRIGKLLMCADMVIESVMNTGTDVSSVLRKSGMFSLLPAESFGGGRENEGLCLGFKAGPVGLSARCGDDVELEPHMMWFVSEGIVLYSMDPHDSDEPPAGRLYEDVEALAKEGIFLPSGSPEAGGVTSAGLMAKEWLYRFSDSYMLSENRKGSPDPYSDTTVLEGGDKLSLGVAALCADAMAKGVAEKGLSVANAVLFSLYTLCVSIEHVAPGSFMSLFEGDDTPWSDLIRHVFSASDLSALENAVRNTFGYARSPKNAHRTDGKRTPSNELGLRRAEEVLRPLSRKELSLYFDPMPKVLLNILKGMARNIRPEIKLGESTHPEWDVSEKTRAEMYCEYLKGHLGEACARDEDQACIGAALKEIVTNIDDMMRNPFVEKLSVERKRYYEQGSERFGLAASRIFETIDPGYVIDEGVFRRTGISTGFDDSKKSSIFRDELKTLAANSAFRRKEGMVGKGERSR